MKQKKRTGGLYILSALRKPLPLPQPWLFLFVKLGYWGEYFISINSEIQEKISGNSFNAPRFLELKYSISYPFCTYSSCSLLQ